MIKRKIIEHVMDKIKAVETPPYSFLFKFKGQDLRIDTINPDSDGLRLFFISHPFAKAFWGEEEISLNIRNLSLYSSNLQLIPKENVGHYHYFLLAWQYHLQQMVLEEEPLTYLEKFL